MAAAAVLGLMTPETAPAGNGSSYAALFDAVWSTTDQKFYDPHFLGHDWRAIGGRFRAKLGMVHSDKDFEKLADAMLDQLGASHLYVIPPHRSQAATVGIGVEFRDIGGMYLANVVEPLSDARMKGVQIGDRLLSPRAELSGPAGSFVDVEMQTCAGAMRTLHIRREGAFWPPIHPGLSWHSVRTDRARTLGYLRTVR